MADDTKIIDIKTKKQKQGTKKLPSQQNLEWLFEKQKLQLMKTQIEVTRKNNIIIQKDIALCQKSLTESADLYKQQGVIYVKQEEYFVELSRKLEQEFGVILLEEPKNTKLPQ